MIAYLRGRILEKSPDRIVLDAAGVGYQLTISVSTFSDLPGDGAETSLHVYTHVREDTLALYGFRTRNEKQLFERLISVSGIGPKLAMTALSGMSADSLVNALRANDVAALTRIPGVGKKTAERMVLELRDKLQGFATPEIAIPTGSQMEEDVISALVNLGYQRSGAEQAAKRAAEKAGPNATFEQLFRSTMSLLQR
jgi:Holliday junction DNA helicase RuvA